MNIAYEQLRKLVTNPRSQVGTEEWWCQFLHEWTLGLKPQLDNMTLGYLEDTRCISSVGRDKWRLKSFSPVFAAEDPTDQNIIHPKTQGLFSWRGSNGVCIYGLTRQAFWIESKIDFEGKDSDLRVRLFKPRSTTIAEILKKIPGDKVWEEIFLNPIYRWQNDRRQKAEIADGFRKNAELANSLFTMAIGN